MSSRIVFVHYINQKIYEKEDGMNILFKKIKIPKVSVVDRNLIDAEITSAKVERAITNSKNGKAHGPDGIPSEVYNTFKSIWVPVFSVARYR